MPIPYDLWIKLHSLIDWVCDNFHRKDEGIWEVRSGRGRIIGTGWATWDASRPRHTSPPAARLCAAALAGLKTDTSTTLCTWWRYARPGRMPGAVPTTARRRSLRASPARKRCGASTGASATQSSGA
jgi:hypothetical protein